jgi:hypothetical protein
MKNKTWHEQGIIVITYMLSILEILEKLTVSLMMKTITVKSKYFQRT